MFVGYSFKTNQYGLAIDNVAGYELVLPNGTLKHVTPMDEDLWFGLRVSRYLIQAGVANGLHSQGGLNNFVGHQFVEAYNPSLLTVDRES